MKAAAGIGNLLRALRHRNFAIYSAGNGVSLIGTWVQRVAAGWLAWELTGSGTWLGLIAFADLFPTVLFGLVAGAAADRWNRLRVIRTSQWLGLLQASLIALLVASGHMTITILFALTLLLGIVVSFNQPARLATIPSLVCREDLGAAVAINAIIFNLARFIGPAVAGVLIATVGVEWAFATNAASFAAFLIALHHVRVETPERHTGNGVPFLEGIFAGLRYAASHEGIAAVLVLMLVTAVGARPVVELLPGFAADVFGSGAGGLAALTSAVGLGAIVGGVWIGSRRSSAGLTRIVLGGALGLGCSIALFTATSWLPLGVVIMVAGGFCMVCTGVAAQTLVQLAVTSDMRGRVLSLYGLIFRGGPALGALTMGIASERLGLRWPVAIGCLAVILCWQWIRRRADVIAASLERTAAEDPARVSH